MTVLNKRRFFLVLFFKVTERKNLHCPTIQFCLWSCYLGFYNALYNDAMHLPINSLPTPFLLNCADKRHSSKLLPFTNSFGLFFLEVNEFAHFSVFENSGKKKK